MSNNKLKYIGFYDIPNGKSRRLSNLAAVDKMNYIASALVKAGYEIEIVSPSWLGDETEKIFEKQKTEKIDSNIKVTFCPSWKTTNKLTRNIKVIFSLVWLFFYLIFNVERNGKILVYHAQWISLPVRLAKNVKKLKIILEVEEIYQDVMIVHPLFTKWENKLIKSANAYIFSNELLGNRITNKRPYVTIYGKYNIYEQLTNPSNDGKIHLLYAGIIDSHKKGAFNAIEATRFLPANYQLHILGFGEIEKMCNLIELYNETNECKISYDGILSGREYVEYCQACHIGLSTQSMTGKYLETSFPSKILSYLSMGLRVVSCHIECVSKSKVGNLVAYYYHDTPEAIADSIKSIDLIEPYDSKKQITSLDEEFIINIRNLLEDQDVVNNR
ncbi:glycosyltransferase family protein [Paenibacillus sp. BAC0078]